MEFLKKYWSQIALIITIVALLFSVRGCIDNGNRYDYFFNKWNNDTAKLRSFENKLGQMSYQMQVNQLTKEELKKYIAENEEFKKLTKSYGDIKALISKNMGVYVDSIYVPFEDKDTLPCDDFEKKGEIAEKDYSFKYLITKKSFEINKLSFPDTVKTIIGERKYGFLNMKRELVLEETHTNKYVQVHSLTPVLKIENDRKKRIRWLSVGIGAGLATGYLIFK